MVGVVADIPDSAAIRKPGHQKNRKNGWLNGIVRLIRYRLHVPMRRSRHHPELIARGVMVGTVWACTPVFGLHMAGSFLTWLISNKFFRWDFSLVNALAWTWTTNVFTVIPCYYLFYLTGQAMLGRFYQGESAGEGFDAIAAHVMAEDIGFWNAVYSWFHDLVTNVGAPLAVGWIPWSILAGWVAYRLSLKVVLVHRERRARKQLAKSKARAR
jgi:uncharacterized protein (DUF2062 family)